MWRLWCRALGEKEAPYNKESNKVVIIRTGILLVYLITSGIIVAGVVRHWNDTGTPELYYTVEIEPKK